MTKAVAYYRVSTQRQGRSGLGLEAQEAAVASYAKAHQLEIVETFTEIETGTRKRHRPELEKAIAMAQDLKATLLIAKLDRLARNVAFLANLMESDLDFVAVDLPQANKMTIHILAAVAEAEAEMISQRTKAALAAAQARGVKLGNPQNLRPSEAGRKGGAVLKARAHEAYKDLSYGVKLLRGQGFSYDKIAKRLNNEGYTTRTGRPFKAMTVWRIHQRNGGQAAA